MPRDLPIFLLRPALFDDRIYPRLYSHNMLWCPERKTADFAKKVFDK